MTMLTVILVLSVLASVHATKDPIDFDIETCVKVFYSKENIYNIYCLTYLDDEESLGIMTDHNDTVIFKKNPDLMDESKICANVLSIQGDEKHCIGSIPINCLTLDENPKSRFVKTPENVPCKEVSLEDSPIYCIGFRNGDFTLVLYCKPVIAYLRRTVFYIPDKKPKRE